MQLTIQSVAGFTGGQIEIQNQGEGYIFRGEIESIGVENNELQVRLAWMAKGDKLPLPMRWINESNLDYAISLDICSVSNIGSSGGDVGGSARLCLTSPIVGEVIVLFPPDDSKLEPVRVEGLELARK